MINVHPINTFYDIISAIKSIGIRCLFGLHSYNEIGEDQSIHRYLECPRCGSRIVQLAILGYQPLRTTWLKGGVWNEVTVDKFLE